MLWRKINGLGIGFWNRSFFGGGLCSTGSFYFKGSYFEAARISKNSNAYNFCALSYGSLFGDRHSFCDIMEQASGV
jgi:hypothetical protein